MTDQPNTNTGTTNTNTISVEEQAEKLRIWVGRVLGLVHGGYRATLSMCGGRDLVRAGDLTFITDADGREYEIAVLPKNALENLRTNFTEACRELGDVRGERDQLFAYLQTTEDEHGKHHRDWVADCQSADAVIDALRTDVARQAALIDAIERAIGPALEWTHDCDRVKEIRSLITAHKKSTEVGS